VDTLTCQRTTRNPMESGGLSDLGGRVGTLADFAGYVADKYDLTDNAIGTVLHLERKKRNSFPLYALACGSLSLIIKHLILARDLHHIGTAAYEGLLTEEFR
jgi:hypothetical protein